MTKPSLAEAGRFLLIVLGVLLVDKLGRVALFDGARENLGGSDIVIAIAAAVIVLGGWLKNSRSVP